MKLMLIDFKKDALMVDIGDIDDIARISITILTGDEVAFVTYKDGTTNVFDSSFTRIIDYWDGEYTVYDVSTGVNLLDDDHWKTRRTSYY